MGVQFYVLSQRSLSQAFQQVTQAQCPAAKFCFNCCVPTTPGIAASLLCLPVSPCHSMTICRVSVIGSPPPGEILVAGIKCWAIIANLVPVFVAPGIHQACICMLFCSYFRESSAGPVMLVEMRKVGNLFSGQRFIGQFSSAVPFSHPLKRIQS